MGGYHKYVTDFSEATNAASNGSSPFHAMLSAFEKGIHDRFTADVPFGAEEELLDRTTLAGQVMGRALLVMLLPLVQVEESGALLERGGQRTLVTWITHAFGKSRKEATDLLRLAYAFHRQELPETATEFWDNNLSLGEASVIARAVERETKKRDTAHHTDAGTYGRMIESGLLAHKRQVPQASVAALDRLARDLGVWFNPTKIDSQEKQAHADRGAVLHQTLDGVFVFRAWGGAADAELFKATLEAFTTPEQYVDDRQQRTYDAWTNLHRFALAHQACREGSGTLSRVNITVPWTTLVGLEGEGPAVTDTGQVLALAEVRALLPDSVIRRLVTDPVSSRVVSVDSTRRVVSASTRAAAFHGHTTCAWAQGCDVPIRFTQADHRVEFHRGGSSRVDNIQPLCSTHNRLKHRLQVAAERRFWKGRARMSPRPEAPNPYAVPNTPRLPGSPPPPGAGGVLRC